MFPYPYPPYGAMAPSYPQPVPPPQIIYAQPPPAQPQVAAAPASAPAAPALAAKNNLNVATEKTEVPMIIPQTTEKLTVEPRPAQIPAEKTANVPPVHFQNLVQQNESIGQGDELKRVYQIIEKVQKDLIAFEQQAAEKEEAKEKEVRTLQEAMGTMKNENALLREENESKPCSCTHTITTCLTNLQAHDSF
jgi:hypothetical protein